jgi:hypothetical protein
MNIGTLFLIISVLVIAHDNIARDIPEHHPEIILVHDLEEDLDCCPIYDDPDHDADRDLIVTLTLKLTPCCRHCPYWRY